MPLTSAAPPPFCTSTATSRWSGPVVNGIITRDQAVVVLHDVGAEQHPAGYIEGDLSLDRNPPTDLGEQLLNSRYGGFDLENVL